MSAEMSEEDQRRAVSVALRNAIGEAPIYCSVGWLADALAQAIEQSHAQQEDIKSASQYLNEIASLLRRRARTPDGIPVEVALPRDTVPELVKCLTVEFGRKAAGRAATS